MLLQWFSIEHRKTKTKAINVTNYEGGRQLGELIGI